MRSLLAILALAACSSPPPPAPAPVVVGDPDPPEIQIALTVEGASLRQVARRLSEESGQAVIVGSAVEPVADCLRLTVLNPEPVPASRVVEQLRGGLAASGVTLEVHPSELRFVAAEGAEPRCPAPPLARPGPRTRTSREAPAVVAEGIRAVSDTEWTIRRSAVDAIGDQALMRSARVIPHQENGQVVGIKVYGVRRRSLLGILGIQNGDMIRSVNGRDLSDPQAALEAYAALRAEERFEVELVRRGEPRTHVYRIVD